MNEIWVIFQRQRIYHENLKANPSVSILVNNSRNQADDIYNAISVTGIGLASIVDKTEKMNVLDMYLKKHLPTNEAPRLLWRPPAVCND